MTALTNRCPHCATPCERHPGVGGRYCDACFAEMVAVAEMREQTHRHEVEAERMAADERERQDAAKVFAM